MLVWTMGPVLSWLILEARDISQKVLVRVPDVPVRSEHLRMAGTSNEATTAYEPTHTQTHTRKLKHTHMRYGAPRAPHSL